MQEERYSAYDAFAALYDQRWGSFARRLLPDVEERVLCRVPPGARILDLCCGTGNLAALLSARGYAVTGVDGSGEMLGFARRNAPQAEFVLADARSFSLPTRFHAAVSLFDSLNHVMGLDELGAVFRNVYAAIEPSGLFFFDVNMAEGFDKRWKGKTFSIIEEDIVCANQSSYDPEKGTARSRFVIFRRDGGWQRTDFTLCQKCYSGEEITAELKKAGFRDVRALDAAKDTRFRDVGRTFFLAARGNAGE